MDMVDMSAQAKAATAQVGQTFPEPIEKVGVIGRFAKNIPRSMPRTMIIAEKARQIEAVGEALCLLDAYRGDLFIFDCLPLITEIRPLNEAHKKAWVLLVGVFSRQREMRGWTLWSSP